MPEVETRPDINIVRLGRIGDLLDDPSVATGSIGPDNDSETETNRAMMMRGEVVRSDASKYYQKLENLQRLVQSCVDGRSPDELGELTANGAGGSIGLYFMLLGTGTVDTMPNFAQRMKDAGLPLGAHDDDQGRNSGCGANDRLLDILQKMQDARGSIAQLRIGLGYGASTTDMDYLATVQSMMTPSADYDKSAGDLAQERTAALEEVMEHKSTHLIDQHGEIAALWNSGRDKATLNRSALSAMARDADLHKDDGTEMEIFNVDAWAFHDTAMMTLQARYGAEFDAKGVMIKDPVAGKPSETEITQAIDFLIDYNLATVLVLGNENLEVLHRQ